MSVLYDFSYLSIQNSAHRSIVYDYSYKVEKNRLNLENKCGLSYRSVITSYHRKNTFSTVGNVHGATGARCKCAPIWSIVCETTGSKCKCAPIIVKMAASVHKIIH